MKSSITSRFTLYGTLMACLSLLPASTCFQIQTCLQQHQRTSLTSPPQPLSNILTTPVNSNTNTNTNTNTNLQMGYNNYGNTMGRSSSRYRKSSDRSKRQERVGHLVRTELASIFQSAYSIKTADKVLEEDLMRRINVVNADISPDLRQARITVSIIQPPRQAANQEGEESEHEAQLKYENSAVAKRRIYSWLVRNTKPIKHALAQRLKHMKTVPNLTFAQADVGAAVDVMYLIDKVTKDNYKREDVGSFDFLGGVEYDEDDEFDWEDEDEEEDGEDGGDDDGWVDEEDF